MDNGNVIKMMIYNFLLYMIPDEQNPYPDKWLTISQLAAKHSYALEEHNVTTEDGYILQLFRLSSSWQNSIKRPPVLCLHGMLLSSDMWVLGGPKRGLAYLLANQGYDVWLGNVRGNKYSRKHTELDPDKNSKFWEYSFNEMGYYDLPAKINYITDITGYEKIFYVGFSQGATSYFVMAATRPEMNQKIILSTLLAPVAYSKDIASSFVNAIAAFQNESENSAKKLGIQEILPYSEWTAKLIDLICRNESPFQYVCKIIVFVFGGVDADELDTRLFPIGVSGLAGTSMQSIFHYTQLINADHFQKYDYGIPGNIQRYNKSSPPVYNIKKVVAPTAIFYGNNDILTTPKSVDKIAQRLPNMVYKHKVKGSKFSHIDFFLSKNIVKKVNSHVLDLMSKYF